MQTDITLTTLQEAAQDALAVQDACNLSGVAHSFLCAVLAVNEEANRLGEGTAWRNKHPIIRLFVDKLASLAGANSYVGYEEACRKCENLAEGRP